MAGRAAGSVASVDARAPQKASVHAAGPTGHPLVSRRAGARVTPMADGRCGRLGISDVSESATLIDRGRQRDKQLEPELLQYNLRGELDRRKIYDDTLTYP